MKLLLTSSGIVNQSLHASLVSLLGKPVAESNALFVPTGIYPFAFGARFAWQAVTEMGQSTPSMPGWKSVGLLELTSLPSVEKSIWVQAVNEADALVVWGGDPLFLAYWLRESGLLECLSSLPDLVYVGVSAGSMAASEIFAETYTAPRGGMGSPVKSEEISFDTPNGPIVRNLIHARGCGFVRFALIPHYNHPDHPDASIQNVTKWAADLPKPVFAIDDQTAIEVIGNEVKVISEGDWLMLEE